MLDKWRDNSLFQETNCSESGKFLIFLEKVYTCESLRFCGIDFQRSIALKEIICLPVFVLTCGLYVACKIYIVSHFSLDMQLCEQHYQSVIFTSGYFCLGGARGRVRCFCLGICEGSCINPIW